MCSGSDRHELRLTTKSSSCSPPRSQRFVERDYDFEARREIVGLARGLQRRRLADDRRARLARPAAAGRATAASAAARVDAMAVMEAIGDALVVEPYLATVALGAQFVARGGSAAQTAAHPSARSREGDAQARVRAGRGGRALHLAHVATRAPRDGDGYVIDGDKRAVAARRLRGPARRVGAHAGRRCRRRAASSSVRRRSRRARRHAARAANARRHARRGRRVRRRSRRRAMHSSGAEGARCR